MKIDPNSIIYLVKAPLESDGKNTITFNNEEEQLNYFLSLNPLKLTDYTYLRKNQSIQVGLNVDSIINYNYLFYKNPTTNKYYYCYITDMLYLNEDNTQIDIVCDVFQTWQFNIKYNPSFIEREHVNDDNIGKHTLPEGLETGPYVIQNMASLFSELNDTYIIIATTQLPNGYVLPLDRQYQGVFSGLDYLAFRSPESAGLFILGMDIEGIADAINSVFLLPVKLLNIIKWEKFTVEGNEKEFGIVGPSTNVVEIGTKEININNDLKGYIPKNNKLYCYPYNYFYITNNAGAEVEYHYEDFVNNKGNFKLIGSIGPGGSIRLIPQFYAQYYNPDAEKYNEYVYGITASKLPICSWNSDVYLNWLTQNSVNIALDFATSAFKAGNITKGGESTTGSALGDIAGTLSEVYTKSFTPNAAKGNTNTSDVGYSAGVIGFPYYQMCIKPEYAIIIDNYFSMFGYKVSNVKIPNITGRRNWNYVKTINCNFTGNIPDNDMQEIKNLFNNGITLWHNPNTIYDYSQNNDII